MLGLAAFLEFKGGPRTAQGIMWFGLGAIVGWPFAGALIVPLLAEEVTICLISGSLGSLLLKILDGAVRCLSILVSSTGIVTTSTVTTFAKTSFRLWKLQLITLSSTRLL